MNLSTSFRLAAALSLPMMATVPASAADTLGQKPVTIIIPLVAGGANDTEMRLYTTRISGSLLPQQIIIDYKPGAAGTIAGTYVSRSTPDGHTLQMISSSFTAIPATIKDLPFDTMKDFTHITQMSEKHFMMVVHPSLPVKTMADYIAYTKANPEKLNIATTGSGSSLHLGAAWLHNLINTKATYVHYKGSGQITLDLVAGRVNMTYLAIQNALPLIKSEKVRPVAMLALGRSNLAPGLPTVSESVPGYSFISYLGISGPAGIPPGVVSQINGAFAKAVKNPEVVKALEAQGSLPVGSSPAEFTKVLQTETERWKRVARDNNITLEE